MAASAGCPEGLRMFPSIAAPLMKKKDHNESVQKVKLEMLEKNADAKNGLVV